LEYSDHAISYSRHALCIRGMPRHDPTYTRTFTCKFINLSGSAIGFLNYVEFNLCRGVNVAAVKKELINRKAHKVLVKGTKLEYCIPVLCDLCETIWRPLRLMDFDFSYSPRLFNNQFIPFNCVFAVDLFHHLFRQLKSGEFTSELI
jgi:hypothetical protein